jgi:hypothetical protein
MANLEIYFNSDLHKYTDNFSNTYTSMTTVIGNYEDKFSDKQLEIATACERIGKNRLHPKYLKYKGKSVKQILSEWKQAGDVGRDIGNTKHDYLETRVKAATGIDVLIKHKSGRLFTIKDLIESNNSLGKLDLSYFSKLGIQDTYPEIFNTIKSFVDSGWSIYSEICTYDYNRLISGLIDILFVKGDLFVILDWKTNKHPLRFESGYYDKDEHGEIKGYLLTNDFLKYPLNILPASTGIKYSLQLSGYANLTEQFGLKCAGLILCHITHDLYSATHEKCLVNKHLFNKNIVNFYPIDYLKTDTTKMFDHFTSTQLQEDNQYNIFKRT